MFRLRQLRLVQSLTLVSLLAGVAFVLAAEPRTWSDRTGKFKIVAKLVAHDKTKATLEDNEGKRFEIEVSKLSAADQKHLVDLGKPADPEDPFKPAGSTGSITPDWTGSRQVEVVAANADWKIAAQPAPDLSFKSTAVALPARKNFFEGCSALIVNPRSRRALVGYHWSFTAPKPNSRILYCDLENGKVLGETTVDGQVTPLAIDDEGARGLFKRTEGKKDTLEIWSLEAKGLKKVLEFSAADSMGRGHDIHWGVFLDSKRLLTASYGGGIVVQWELPSLKPTYHLLTQGSSVPGLSHDRKLLAFTTGQQLGILDVDAGKVIALRPVTGTPWASLAFSPGGKWLACGTHNRILVWDLATGEQHKEIFVTPTDVWGYITWPDDRMMLVGNKSLLDLDLAYRFWEYKDQNQVQIYRDQGWFVTHDNQGGAVVPAPVPTPAVRAALEKAIPEIVLKPGTAVKIDVSALPDEADRAKTAKALEDQLTKKGCKVAPDGAITLVASAGLGKQIEMNFVPQEEGRRDFPFLPKGKGPGPRIPPGTKVRRVNLQEHIARLKFVVGEKTVWESSGDNVPKSVRLDEGETLEQRMKKLERPPYKFFETVDLPRLLHRDKGANPIGVSQVTVSGVR